MSPALRPHSAYRSEADFYSAALVLLELVSDEDFGKFNQQRQQPSSLLTPYALDFYLNKIGDVAGESETKKVLEKNPELKNIINLMFQVSEGGEKGEAAFKQWQTAFHAYKNQST